MNEQEHNRWKWDKHVNVAHILTTLAMVGSIFAWINATDKRITVVEERLSANQTLTQTINSAAAAQIALMREEFKSLRDEISRTNDKLDRMIQNQLRNRTNDRP